MLSPNPLKTKLKAEREKKLQADIDKLVAESEKKLALLNKLPTDADYASALKDWIVFYEQADKLQSTAQKRFDAILEASVGAFVRCPTTSSTASSRRLPATCKRTKSHPRPARRPSSIRP